MESQNVDLSSKAVDSRNTIILSSVSNSSDEDSHSNRNDERMKEITEENKQIANVSPSSPHNKLQTILTNKKRIIHRYFDELNQTYVQAHNKDWKDFHIKGRNYKQKEFFFQHKTYKILNIS